MIRVLRKWWPLLAVAGLIGGAAHLVFKPAAVSEVASARPRAQVSASSDVLDFGSTALNAPVVRQLLLRNVGDEPVVAVLSVDSSETPFVTDVGRVTLMPAVSSRIPVRLNASRPGQFVDRLKISFPNGAEPLMIELRGRTIDETATPRGSDVAGRQLEQARPLDEAGRASADGGQPPAAGSAREPASTSGSRMAGRAGEAGSYEGSAARPYRSTADAGQQYAGSEGAGVSRVYPFDPAVSAPVVGVADSPPQIVADRMTAADRAAARPLHESVPDAPAGPGGSDPADGDDSPTEDPPKPEEVDPGATPILTLSNLSAVTLLGTSVRFSPQGIRLEGSPQGGSIGVQELIQFPLVPLAFGESMQILQAGPGAGVFNPAAGAFKLQLPLVVVDNDGDAAPVLVELTTGTSYGRNDAGIVVSLSGSPRAADSGWLKLVGLQKIPVGFRNGAEDHLVMFEILGRLSFNSQARSAP